MPHLPFIVAAYAVTILGLAGMLWLSLRRMRRAERALDGDS
ncbi:MAG: heme exporter protein CcmD [Sandarakinorhabdus sp.]|nr:heme exporter protein CcmD [Sandarakinorhabdus sp.]